MEGFVARHAAAVWMWKLAEGLSAFAGSVRHGARRLDAWLAARDKAADDRAVLQAMSARELRDIGLDPSTADVVARDGWTRDWAG